MKRTFQITFTCILMLWGSITYGESLISPQQAIIGHWVFNKHETVLSFENSKMAEDEVNEFSAILKPQELVISDVLYSVHKPGRKPIQTAYSVISESDGCVILQFKDSRIPFDIQRHEFCIKHDQLLLPAPKEAYEVYDRKL